MKNNKVEYAEWGSDGRRVAFYCPGCGELHALPVDKPQDWKWNRSLDKPTITPSILVRTGHYAKGSAETKECWCNFEERTGKKSNFKCQVCHSFVTDGRIQFLGDCTHELAGQTVDLPDLTEPIA